MQLTAAVINAGLGDVSLGLERAGFKIVAAYENEEKAAKIHQLNFEVPVCNLPIKTFEIEGFPQVDLLAAHIYAPHFSSNGLKKATKYEDDIYFLRTIFERHKPRAFFFLINAFLVRSEKHRQFLEDMIPSGYKLLWKVIDVAQMTGFPVKENLACVIGVIENIEGDFEFPFSDNFENKSLSMFLEYDKQIDSWYYRMNLHNNQVYENESELYCWKHDTYVGTDCIHWNYLKLPLIRAEGAFRKITHREIANLKGYPKEYDFSCQDRNWLYKKLMFSGNVLVIQQIAGMLNYRLSSNPWRAQKRDRGYQLEKIFGSYLETIQEKRLDNSLTIKRDSLLEGYLFDFIVYQGNNTYCFEIKNSLNLKTKVICRELAGLNGNSTIILVVADEVSEDIKKEYFENYGVYIWDVANLLWLFEAVLDIKNEFVAFLEYSTEQIEPNSPLPELVWTFSAAEKKEPDLKKKLLKINHGKEQFRKYEETCIEILKYVLGEYLTLWEVQESSNDGLYRFDLCCKIKHGINHDFFDTIKQHFNTKYIVFEFKNCQEKITQKEIYTTEKYLYEKALRKVAIIISRQGADDNALKAAKGSLREHGKLIICLSNNSLLEMIDIKMRGGQEPADFLSAILDDILVHLEK